MSNSVRVALSLMVFSALGAMPLQAQIGGLIRKKVTDVVTQPPKKPPADSAKTPKADSIKAPATTAKADPKIWENYDFVPGNRVLFYTDFSEDRVGNFARGLKYRSGPAEVVDRDGVKMFRATGRTEFLIPVGKKLPERFTLEIDVIAPEPKDGEHDIHEMLTFEGGAETDRGAQSASVVFTPSMAWIQGGGQYSPASNVTMPEAMRPLLRSRVTHLRVLMDSEYLKMYANERRLYNIPELPFKRDSVIRLMLNAADDTPVYLTSIRVAESETDVMYDALANKGRWMTQGILFATGKADIQPESRPVLKEIAGTMKQHADLKILIEGHTDNVGTAAGNLTLSDARAAAVKAALVADFGIDDGRITTRGLGDTRPAVPNTTVAGRAQNRRVELVKQ
jgi:outer membrane protein OmpA-like peptidoglycan-associated protein